MKKIHALCLLFLILTGLDVGFYGLFRSEIIGYLFGFKSFTTRIICVVVGLSALNIGFSRDFYLPFLGETVLPCSLLTEKIPEKAELKVRIIAEPGKKVVYWAAEPESPADKALRYGPSWKEAYGKFENAGISIAEEDGSALLQVRRPRRYWVPPGRKLEPHIHYRICAKDGMLGPVKSLFIEERAEGFGNAIHI